MKPTQHIILTTLAYFALESRYDLGITVLIGSLLATLILDVVDHAQSIIRSKRKLSKTLSIKSIWNSYKDYLGKRAGEFKPLFHTPFWLIASICLALIFNSFIIWLGVVFHFACDIADFHLSKKEMIKEA